VQPRSSLLVLACLLAAPATSCSVETTKYQAPEALKGKAPPAPNGPLPNGDSTPVAVRTCAAQPQRTNPCPVTWTQIYNDLINKAWNCTNPVCHGQTPPVISATNPATAYAQLSNAQLKTNVGTQKFYIDVCGNDPNTSSITCNVTFVGNTAPCPDGMPLQGYAGINTPQPTAEDMQKVKTWLACGAPP